VQQFFENIGQSTRIVFIALAFFVTVLLGLQVKQTYQSMQFEANELQGLHMLRWAEELNVELGEYRGMCTSWLAGAEVFEQFCADRQQSVKHVLDKFPSEAFQAKGVQQQYQKLMSQWTDLDSNKQTKTATEFFEQVSRINHLNLDAMAREYATSGLELDSGVVSYRYGRLIADVIPELQNDLGLIRGYGSMMIASGTVAREESFNLVRYESNVKRFVEIIRHYQMSMINENLLDDDMQQAFQKAIDQINYFVGVNVKILSRQQVTSVTGTESFFNTGTLPIVALSVLHERLTDDLEEILSQRYSQHISMLLLLCISYSIMMAVLWFLYRRMLAAVQELTHSESRFRDVSDAKSEFLANMSHELRTPLNGIYGVLQIIDTDKDQPRHLRKLTKIALESTELLTGLIGNALDMEKIENREVVLENDAFVLNILLETYMPTFRNLAEKNKVLFTVLIEPDCHLYWSGDKMRIMQVLNNVVGNAIKFSAGKTVELIASSNEQSICFVVRDTGRGMDSETLDNLFKRFHKGRFNAVEGIESTGLGMAITKELIDLMGGTINVTSVLTKGTECIIELPLEKMDAPLNPEQAILQALNELTEEDLGEDVRDWRDCHVLLVDDAMTNLFVIEAMLATMVRQVSIASSGFEALEIFAQNKIDLLVSDISMPGMNGMTLLKKVRSFQPFIPAVALSGNIMSKDFLAYRDAGYDEVLAKPVQKRELQAALEKAFMLKQAEQSGEMPSADNLTLH